MKAVPKAVEVARSGWIVWDVQVPKLHLISAPSMAGGHTTAVILKMQAYVANLHPSSVAPDSTATE